MRTTIDKAGRIVVPKALREELGLRPGSPLEITAIDGRLEVEPPRPEVRISMGEDGRPVIDAPEVGALSLEDLRAYRLRLADPRDRADG